MKGDTLSTDAVLNSTAPSVSPAEAVAIARIYFGIEATAENLSSERDTNYHLVAPDGCGYALKFANAAEPALERDEVWWNLGIPVRIFF